MGTINLEPQRRIGLRVLGPALASACLASALLSGAAHAGQAAARPPAGRSESSHAGPIDQRWHAWLGCWRLADENVRRPSLIGRGGPVEGTPRPDTNDGVLVCFEPAVHGPGVSVTTFVDGRPALTQTIVPDASRRAIDEPVCRGWQLEEWSPSGGQLFARAEVVCADEQQPRIVSALSILGGDGTWIEIQVIGIAGRESLRVRRYGRVADPEASAPQTPVRGKGLTVEDVEAACARLSPLVVEAALVETRPMFDLHGKRLVALDEAGVPDSVIDLMVALSFPKRFVVEGPGGADPWSLAGLPGWPTSETPWWWEGLDACSAFWDAYCVVPLAYGFWGALEPAYYTDYGFEPVVPAPPEHSHGKVVNGLGYARVLPREDDRTTTGGGEVSGGEGGSPASHGGVSPAGYSSSSSSSDSERTAQSRPPR